MAIKIVAFRDNDNVKAELSEDENFQALAESYGSHLISLIEHPDDGSMSYKALEGIAYSSLESPDSIGKQLDELLTRVFRAGIEYVQVESFLSKKT